MASEYYSGGDESSKVLPTETKIVLTFLGRPGTKCSEAWLLARGGMNNDGPLVVQLKNQEGMALSDPSEVHGQSSSSRIKMTNVRVPASDNGFPPVIRVEATNRSTVSFSNAFVNGVRLMYDD